MESELVLKVLGGTVGHRGLYAESVAAEEEVEYPQKCIVSKLGRIFVSESDANLTKLNDLCRAERFMDYALQHKFLAEGGRHNEEGSIKNCKCF